MRHKSSQGVGKTACQPACSHRFYSLFLDAPFSHLRCLVFLPASTTFTTSRLNKCGSFSPYEGGSNVLNDRKNCYLSLLSAICCLSLLSVPHPALLGVLGKSLGVPLPALGEVLGEKSQIYLHFHFTSCPSYQPFPNLFITFTAQILCH